MSAEKAKADRRRQARVQGAWNSGPARRSGGGVKQTNKVDGGDASSAQQKPQVPAANQEFVFDGSVSEVLAREAELASKPVTVDKDGDYELSIGRNDVKAVVQMRQKFLSDAENRRLLAELNRLPWQQRMGLDQGGQPYQEPRETCWFGRPYTYSHVKWEATDDSWPQFNSVMCNRYRDGKDKIGWHADDEPSLGRQPVIASLSFGETRRFMLRRRDCRVQTLRPLIGDPITVPLQSGDLLVMRGSLQEDWLHSVPPEYHDKESRINLTFRVIEHSPNEQLCLRPGPEDNENKQVTLSARPGQMQAQLCCYRPRPQTQLLVGTVLDDPKRERGTVIGSPISAAKRFELGSPGPRSHEATGLAERHEAMTVYGREARPRRPRAEPILSFRPARYRLHITELNSTPSSSAPAGFSAQQ
uniref:Fe2OG dioxygenase domain-containing protein n=1 Tax=Macrostomum lignano TaxID=282301 RepID=A0A1I8FGL7_9PLAT